MCGCSGLRDLDLCVLQNVTIKCYYFLYDCKGLESIRCKGLIKNKIGELGFDHLIENDICGEKLEINESIKVEI